MHIYVILSKKHVENTTKNYNVQKKNYKGENSMF